MDKFFLNRLNRYILDFVSYLFIINDFKNNFKNCEISLKKKILLLSKKKIKIQNQKFKNIINLLLKMSAQKLIDYYFSEKNLPTALKKRKGKFVVHCYSLYSISWVKLLINKNPQFFGFIDSFEYGFKDKLYGKMILNSISSIKSSIDYIVIINRQKKITKKITKHYVKAGFKRSNIYEISYT